MIFRRKVLGYLNSNKYMFLIIFTAISAGVIAGSFGAMRAENFDIAEPLHLENEKIMASSFLTNLKLLTWIAIWGLNVIGFPVIIYLLYSKGAYFAAGIYSVLILENTNKLIAVLSIIPYFVCMVAALTVLSYGSLDCSHTVLKSVLFSKNQRKASKSVLKLAICFLISTLLALLGGVCEAWLKVNIT